MAPTPEQIDALPEYTNAQMVKLIRWAISELVANPNSQVTMPNGGRSYTLRNLPELQQMLAHFEQLAAQDAENAAADSGYGGSVVVRFVEGG